MSFKFKDYILPLILAIGVTFIFRNLFFTNKTDTNLNELESGRSHTAPRIQEVHRPLDLEINFIDSKTNIEATKTLVETGYAKYTFSNEGASIDQIEYKHKVDSKEIILNAFNSTGKEDRAFLTVFSKDSPFYYKLESKDENEFSTILTYKAEFDQGEITKKFTIYKNISKIDLEINVSPSKTIQEPIRLRIFYPSPFSSEINNDVIQGIMNEGTSINKKISNSLLQRYWEIPSLFGLEDRYFVHSLVKDANNFAQRGYFKSMGSNLFFAVLEGPPVKEPTTWNLTFYFGPKKLKEIQAVDPRLERTLDYGYLAPFAKPLLVVLNFFYKYFKSFGIAIILLTLLIKLLLLPFTLKGEQSMKKRLEFQKKLQYIQQKYKDDKEALMVARAELIKKHGIADMAGCLPLLLQLPIFFALNRILSTAFELYKAPFLWIPNLSARDPYFILPILISISIVIYSSKSTDPRQRFSSYGIALLLAAVSINLPAGLSLFIFMSSILTVAQSKLYSMIKKA